MAGTSDQAAPVGATDRTGERQTWILAAVATLAGLSASIVLGLASDGAYHDDDICHFLFARDAWSSVHALLHQWARPG